LIQRQRKNPGCLGKILTIRESGKDRKPGVTKTKENTDQMVRYASMLMRSYQLRISENMRTGRDTTPDAMISKLVDQMRGFRCEVKLNKNDIMSDPKFKWLGDKDDLIVAMMEGLYWEKMFWLSDFEGYAEFKRRL